MQLNKTESLREAQKHLDQGRLTAAMSIYQKIVDGDSSDLAAISMLGDLYVKSGRVTDAIEHFLRISENYLRSGSAISAAYILRKVIKIDPTNPQALMSLGELDFQDKKLDLAHNNFIEAGAAFWNKGNITAAIQMNKRALEINPDSRLAKVALALIGNEKQEPDPPQKRITAELAPQKRTTTELRPLTEWPTAELPPISELPDIMISISDGSDAVCSPEVSSNNQFSISQLSDSQLSDSQLIDSLISDSHHLSDSQTQTGLSLDSSNSITQPESLPQPDEDAIIEQIATAEFLVGCGQVDKAFAQLRESLHDRPDHIQIREKLKDIFLRCGMIDRASEECVNIAGIYTARGDSSRAKDYITRARRLISPEPYSSPVELGASKLNTAEETPETGPGWSPDLTQAVSVM